MRRIITIDPHFVADAIREGRTLVLDVGDHHCKVSLGDASKHGHTQAAALKMGARLG